MLYGILLNRMQLSRRNHWVDANNRVYIIYPMKKMAKRLKASLTKTSKVLQELDDENGVGLVKKIRRGQGRLESKKLEEIGIDKKTADSVIRAFENAEKKAKNPKENTLDKIKKFASKTIKNRETDKSKLKEFANEKVNQKSGQER